MCAMPTSIYVALKRQAASLCPCTAVSLFSLLLHLTCSTYIQMAALSKERDSLAQKYAAIEQTASVLQQQDEVLK